MIDHDDVDLEALRSIPRASKADELNAAIHKFVHRRGFHVKYRYAGRSITYFCTGENCPWKVWFVKDYVTRTRTKEECMFHLSADIRVMPSHAASCDSCASAEGLRTLPTLRMRCRLCNDTIVQSLKNHILRADPRHEAGHVDSDNKCSTAMIDPTLLAQIQHLAAFDAAQCAVYFDQELDDGGKEKLKSKCKLCEKLVLKEKQRAHLLLLSATHAHFLQKKKTDAHDDSSIDLDERHVERYRSVRSIVTALSKVTPEELEQIFVPVEKPQHVLIETTRPESGKKRKHGTAIIIPAANLNSSCHHMAAPMASLTTTAVCSPSNESLVNEIVQLILEHGAYVNIQH